MITRVSSATLLHNKKTEHPKLFLSKQLETLIKDNTLGFPVCSRTVHEALVMSVQLSKFCP